MAGENILKLTTYVRKELTFDRDELRAALSMFVNWSESNGQIAVSTEIDRQHMIDRFITVMAGENVVSGKEG